MHKPTHIRDLVPDPQNRRQHNPRNIGMIVDALNSVGAARSIVIDEDNQVLAGNGAVEAAAEAEFTKVQVVEVDGSTLVAVKRRGLSEEQKRALALYDNRTAELAEWNPEQLRADQTAELDLEPWFSAKELLKIVGITATDGLTDPNTVPGARKTEIQTGDLFDIGAHVLLCGDGTTADDLSRIVDTPIDLLVTSPPYNQRIDTFRPSGMHREGDWVTKVERLAYEDSMPEEAYQAWQRAALTTWYAMLRDGASVFYNHKNRYRDKGVLSPLQWLPGPFTLRQEIIWSRPGSVTQNARMFLPSDERIYWLYKGADFYFDDRTDVKSYATVWTIELEINKDHATAFPVELPRRCIEACSKPAETVLEPFAGSGTTLMASEQLGRRCRAVEQLPVNCQIIIDRWEAFTGQKAVKVGEAVRA